MSKVSNVLTMCAQEVIILSGGIMEEKNVNLNIRTNKALKDEVGAILHNLGLNHSIVINMLYKQIAILKGLPFPVKIPNKRTVKAIEELETKKGAKSQNSDELFEDLGI